MNLHNVVKSAWLDAQGIPWHNHNRWKNKGLFHRYPPKCTYCGKEWRSDMKPFITVIGRYVILEGMFDNFGVWRCEELGGFSRSTGLAKDHVREICWDHGPAEVWDCVQGINVWVGLPKSKWRTQIESIKYWGLVVIKFPVKLLMGIIWRLIWRKYLGDQ